MGTSGIADGGPTAVAATAVPRGVEGLPLSQLRIVNLVHEHVNTGLLFLEEKMFFILIRQHRVITIMRVLTRTKQHQSHQSYHTKNHVITNYANTC